MSQNSPDDGILLGQILRELDTHIFFLIKLTGNL